MTIAKRCLLIAFVAMLAPLLAQASEPAFKEGKAYVRLESPLPTRHPDKIVVTEFFWYGCIHCFHFEPMLEEWAAKLPKDVVLERSPAIWKDRMRLHARAYYTAKALGVLDKVNQPLFNALNVDGKPLATEAAIGKIFEDHGVSKEKFDRAFNSFGVSSEVRQADARARSARIDGTPTLTVNGTYRISNELAGGQEEMLKVADFLIDKIRKERAGQN